MSKPKWSYGVTTVTMKKRKEDLLPRTLESLKKTGFDKPHLFVDGLTNAADYDHFGLHVVPRGSEKLRPYGNWVLALWELYIREPNASYYAIFQDDFVTGLNLREYIERVDWPGTGYLNLYTFPENQDICPEGHVGFYPSNQKGKGAVALIFNFLCVQTLLTSLHMVGRVRDARRGHRLIDGGVVTAMTKVGFTEYVHSPSLVQHTGYLSSIGNRVWPVAPSFRGEDFDYLELLK